MYLLNGPGLAPQKAHILRLGINGRIAINIVDDIIVVHHQATGTSMLFDIGLPGSPDGGGVFSHEPLTVPRSIRPMALPMPSLSFAGQTKSCELCELITIVDKPHLPSENHIETGLLTTEYRFCQLGAIPAGHCDRCETGLLVVRQPQAGDAMQPHHGQSATR